MRRLALSCLSAMIAMLPAFPQDHIGSILYLTGASAPEELEAEALERFDALASRPVRINTASEARLVSSGLFSRYQAASIADYRRSSGDILSLAEFALVDGIGEEAARALAPFVSFETGAPPGRSSLEGGNVRTEALTRAQAQASEGEAVAGYALKLRSGDEDRWLLSLAMKRSGLEIGKQAAGNAERNLLAPDALSGSAAVYGRRRNGKVVLGDYNARFGQGLLLWSGFSLSGVQSAAAMDRHPSGLSPAWTLSPDAAHRGAAADIAIGRFVLSGFWSSGKCLGANATWLARYGQLGLTLLGDDPGEILRFTQDDNGKEVSEGLMNASGILARTGTKLSGDWRWSLGKFDLFGEVVMDASANANVPAAASAGAFAVVAGAAWNPAYQVRLAASVRSYPAAYTGALAGALRSSSRSSDERGAALALDCRKLSLTADAALHPSKGTSQLKGVAKYSPQLAERLSFSFRAVSRYRPRDPYPSRNELRGEALAGSPDDGFSLKGLAAVCRSAGTSWAAYLEAGYRKETGKGRFQAYLRGTAFKADRWEDRIYIYERDVPGAFSVPALYGRGCSASAAASLKRRHVSLHARAWATAYPGMAEKKPSKSGLKLQLQLSF